MKTPINPQKSNPYNPAVHHTELSSKDITTQIDLLLEDKNSGLIDDASISMLRTFRNGMFIGNGTPIPVSRYTDAS